MIIIIIIFLKRAKAININLMNDDAKATLVLKDEESGCEKGPWINWKWGFGISEVSSVCLYSHGYCGGVKEIIS